MDSPISNIYCVASNITDVTQQQSNVYNSADHHLEYSRAVYSRLRMNISASNGAILKVVDLKLAKRGSVKVWGILVKNSPFCLKMSASGNSSDSVQLEFRFVWFSNLSEFF